MELGIIALLLIGYAVYYFVQMQKIIIASEYPIKKRLFIILIGVAFCIFFVTTQSYLMLLIGSLLIIIAFQKEGLSEEGVVKFGVLNGSFTNYSQVNIHSENNKTYLEFQSHSRRLDVSMSFNQRPKNFLSFFRDKTTYKLPFHYHN